ncbi:MAG: hypothetical protein GY953_04660, partial [bacterium]|nr:hypothetical protein [bacterium]
MSNPSPATPHGPPLSRLWTRAAFWVLVAAMGLSLWAVVFRVDLSPRVESDFFFSTEDPAFQASQQISELFPSSPQLILSAQGPDVTGEEYVGRIRELSDALLADPQVDAVQ